MPFPRPDYVDRATRRADLHTEGVKGLFLLNGGAIVSMLTFLTQVLLGNSRFISILGFVIAAIGCWTIGLIVLAPINHLRYETSRLFDREETRELGKKYGLAHRILFYVSLVLFVAGVACSLGGLWVAKDLVQ